MLWISFLGWQNWHRDWMETSFLALLPSAEQRPQVADAMAQHNRAINRKLIWLTSAATSQQAIILAEQLQQDLTDSGLFAQLMLQVPQYQQHYQQMFAYRYQLLDDATRQRLGERSQQLHDENMEWLYSPLAAMQLAGMEHDPWLLFNRYINAQQPLQLNIERGVIVLHDGSRYWALLISELHDQDLKLDKLESLLHLRLQLEQRIKAEAGELLVTGMPLFTAYGADVAQQEISTIGVGSTVGVVLLLLLTFRSPRPLLLSSLAVASGLLAAWVLSLMIFGKLQVLTLVFGSSLIGVVVDYALHFFCDGIGIAHWTPRQGLKYVLPGIAFGLLTSLLGYAGMGFSAFPGLQQIAVFSAIGLTVSWLTVVMLFPCLLTGFKLERRADQWPLLVYWQQRWPAWLSARQSWLSMVLGLFIVGGILQLTAKDDVRLLQTAPADLLAMDAKIKQLLPLAGDQQFFLVSGKNQAEWYQHEQALLVQLAALQSQSVLKRFDAISRFWPDAQRQRENYQLLKTTLYRAENLRQYMDEMGFTALAFQGELAQFAAAEHREMSLDAWLATADETKRQLWMGCDAEACRSMVTLSGISDIQALKGLQLLPGVIWADQVGQLTDLFQRYRIDVGFLLVAVCGLILAILVGRLGWRRGFKVMAVPVVAMLSALAVLGWCGELFTLFNLFALLLVLEVGIDYAIFFQMADSGEVDANEKRHSTALAIALSAFTTLLAYGLLAACSTVIVHAFGVTLLAGVSTAFLLAPLVGAVEKGD